MDPMRRILWIVDFLKTYTNSDFLAFICPTLYRIVKGYYCALRAIEKRSRASERFQLQTDSVDAI